MWYAAQVANLRKLHGVTVDATREEHVVYVQVAADTTDGTPAYTIRADLAADDTAFAAVKVVPPPPAALQVDDLIAHAREQRDLATLVRELRVRLRNWPLRERELRELRARYTSTLHRNGCDLAATLSSAVVCHLRLPLDFPSVPFSRVLVRSLEGVVGWQPAQLENARRAVNTAPRVGTLVGVVEAVERALTEQM